MTWMEPVDQAALSRERTPPPVLACPQVCSRPRFGLNWVLRTSLERHLDALRASGWRFLALEEFEAALEGQQLKERQILLTFDHASPEFLDEVAPVLLAREIPCVLFVPTASVGRVTGKGLGPLRARNRQLGWQQLRDLSRVGVRAQASGHHLMDLRSVSPEIAFGELIRARREIERRLQQEARALTYPFGSVDRQLADLASRAGFTIGFGNGKWREETGFLNLPRLRLRAADRSSMLVRRLERSGLRGAEGVGGS